MDNIHDKLKVEQLPQNQRELAELLGMRVYVELTRRFGGETIYIQKYSELLKTPRNVEIKQKFDGYNFVELAKEYDLSERYIRELVSDITTQVRSRPMEGQVTFEDF
ncbi:MAG: Mor transcription activator family protein [Candidatus Fimivivens sp.]